MFMNSISINSIQFQDITFSSRGQKQVDLSFDKTSKSWSNKVITQVCKDETSALYSKYGLSKPLNDQDGFKRNLELILEDETVIKKIQEIDEYILNYAIGNSKELFRKELTREQVEAKYKSILKEKNGEKYIIIKVKCNPNDKPTPIKILDSLNSKISNGCFTDIIPGTKVVPVVRLLSLWFMTDTFGLSLQADKLMIIPGKKKKFTDDMILTKEFIIKE